MEAVAVLGSGKCPFASSVVGSPAAIRGGALSFYTSQHPFVSPTRRRHVHLCAICSPSFLFSYFPHSPHGKAPTRRNSTTPHIFLPHLVASMEQVDETYIMIKPDGVQRGLVGEIISRFEKKGFKMTGLKLFHCPRQLAEEHYKDLKSKSFFPKLVEYITSGPVVCMAWEGVGVVASARKLIGSTNPLQAEPGTIRGDLAVQTGS